ncbi:MAG: hypothetical protein IKH84_05475, partial [Ottowia sp.]|nr:hypothetical protein [Ottowia sp.]
KGVGVGLYLVPVEHGDEGRKGKAGNGMWNGSVVYFAGYYVVAGVSCRRRCVNKMSMQFIPAYLAP